MSESPNGNHTYLLNRAASRAKIPWKNGLGWMYDIVGSDTLSTHLSSIPSHSSAISILSTTATATKANEDWTWKLSTADISHDVAFSSFPNTTRKFCVADGAGVILNINGSDIVCEPLSITTFRGDDVVFAKLINGPLRVLNLIIKDNSMFDFHFAVQKNSGSVSLPEPRDLCEISSCIVTALCGEADIGLSNGETVTLKTLDSLLTIVKGRVTVGLTPLCVDRGIIAALSIGPKEQETHSRL